MRTDIHKPTEPTGDETTPARWQWAVIDTMDGPANASLILDGDSPRNFSRVNRASIARHGLIAREIPTVIDKVVASGETRSQYVALADDKIAHLIGVPILGPSGAVHAVAVWTGNYGEPLPRIPIIGAAEWNGSGIVAATNAAMFLLRTPAGDALTGHTIPEILSAFDSIERDGFLAMFNLPTVATPTDHWSGVATLADEAGQRHDVHIVTRATLVNGERRVRAVVADITGAATPGRPDLTLAAFRHVPVPGGHALALADLKTGFIHEWMVAPNSVLASWRHHNPQFHPDDHIDVINAVFTLAAGLQATIDTSVRVRFAEDAEWMHIDAHWTRILDGDRPQALIDITPRGKIPVPVVADCQVCQEMAAATTKTAPRP
ncbi:GAF domain-containing protein [Nocardia sp. NBC_00511]|uniref:GAF domain-containing protein n=1 Tax=Nocardia sp. NBC_00511 TaxID=2903591 RepID=UPI002F917CCF